MLVANSQGVVLRRVSLIAGNGADAAGPGAASAGSAAGTPPQAGAPYSSCATPGGPNGLGDAMSCGQGIMNGDGAGGPWVSVDAGATSAVITRLADGQLPLPDPRRPRARHRDDMTALGIPSGAPAAVLRWISAGAM